MGYNEVKRQLYEQAGGVPPAAGTGAAATSQTLASGAGYEGVKRQLYNSIGYEPPDQITSSVRNFFNDANRYFQRYNQDVSGEDWFDAAGYFSARQQESEGLKNRAMEIGGLLDSSKDLYEQDSWQSMMDYLSAFDTQVDDVLRYYQPILDAQAGMRAYEDDILAYRQRQQGSQIPLYAQAGFLPDITNPVYGFLQMQDQYRADNSYLQPTEQWSDEERFTLGTLQQEDPAQAREYARQINDMYTARETEADRKAIRDYATSGIGAGAAGTAGALGLSVATSIPEFLDRMAEYTARGTTTEKAGLTPADFSNEVVGGITNALNRVDANGVPQRVINESIPVIGGKGWGDVYGLGYSIAQNVLSRYTMGAVGGQAAVLANYFANAATAGIDEARRRGATGDQAMGLGLVKGALEVGTEFIPTARLFKLGPATTIRDLLKEVGVQTLEEFVGEGANAALGYLADKSIMGNLSEFETAKRDYMEAGLTEDQATAAAIRDAVENVLFEGLSGAISGAVSGGTEIGVKTGIANQYYRNNYAGAGNDLVFEGLDSPEGTLSRTFAEEMQKRIAQGYELTPNQMRIQATYNEQQIAAEDRAEIKASVIQELQNRGVTENADAIAETVVKQISGEKLTKAEARLYNNSEAAQNIHSEMENDNAYREGKWGTGIDALMQDYQMRLVNQNRLTPDGYTYADRSVATTQEESGNRSGRAMAVGDVKVSQTGAAVHIPTKTEVSPLDFDSVEKGKATVLMKDSSTAAYEEVAFDSEIQGNQFYAAASLPGIETEAANKMLHTIQEADVGHNADEVVAIKEAYGMGYINAARRDLATNPELRPLNQQLRETLYDIGQQQRAVEKLSNPTPAPEITPAEGYNRVVFEGKVSTGNKAVEAQVKFVDFIAENFAKTNVHVYESYSRGGKRYYRDSQGVEHEAPNGKYYKGEIWLDTKSGDKGEGLMLNTFAHEMYHHLKANNAAGAGKLEKFIASELGIQNVNAAIDRQIRKARAAGWGEAHFRAEGMTEIQAANEVYQRAVEDFYADALETVFTRGDPQKAIARLKKEDRGLFDQIKDFIDQWVSKLKKFYSDKTISIEGEMVARLKNFEQLQQMFMEEMQRAGENVEAGSQTEANAAQTEMSNEEAFRDSATAVMNSIRPPYSDGSKEFNLFVDALNPEARKTFDLFYGFYQRSRITNTVSVSGKRVKAVNISSLYLLAQDWNDMLAKEPKWAAAAKDLAEFLPADVRKRMNMNEDGSLNPTTMEKEFKMPSSMAQRLVDALSYENIEAKYQLGDKTITLPEGKARQSVGGEAYRRAILAETRKLFTEGKLRPVGIGTMSKDRWGSLGFLAANGKTGASGDFTTVCPQMMFNRGCWYCYRRAAMEKGVNNKLVANSVWYTGEILRIKDSDIKALNENGGLRIQSFGDWMPHFSAMLADVLYDAEIRGLQVKIITKEPSMINYIAALREQGIGKNLYFNLSADYTIERGPARQAQGGTSLDAVNPERPFMRDQDNNFWWKRAMTVEEAAKYREKYPWVNTRIVATDVAEFIRGLRDNRVDVVTGYHGNIRGIERIDSATGARKIEVEALGDAGMPRFAFDSATGQWVTEYGGKTATHKRLAKAIADNGLYMEYYTKTCCITGRCASCKGKCGKLARDFNVKNATNRDAESVAYWQKEMGYAETPEFGDLTEASMNSLRNTPESVHDVRRRLADAFDAVAAGSRLQSVKDKAEEYRVKIAEAERLESDLGIVRDQIRDLRESRGSKGKVKELTKQALTLQRQLDAANRRILYIEGLKPFREAAQADRQAYAKAQQITRQEEQRQAITQRNLENRIIREEMTGRDSDITIMEKEFIRIVKMYEKLSASEKETVKLNEMLNESVKAHKEDASAWKKKYNELLRQYMTSGRKIERLEQTILRQRQRAKELAQSRRDTEMRYKIQRRVNELNQVLIRGTKDRNVPEGMQSIVAEILDALNMEVRNEEQRRKSYDATLARYDRLIAAETDETIRADLMEKRNQYAGKGDQFAKKVASLKEAYDRIRDNADPVLASAYDEGLSGHLKKLVDEVGNTPLGQMTPEQMDAVYEILTSVQHTIREANKARVEGKKLSIAQMGKDAMREVQSTGGQGRKGKDITKTRAALEKFGWNNMRPIDAMEAIGSKMLLGLYKGMRKGEDIWARDTAEARKFFLEQWNKHGGKNWDMEEKRSFEAASGDTFQLNLEQRMSIYAHFRREQSREHLRKGGFVFDPGAGKKITQDATAYNLTDETIGEIIGSLTGAQMAFVEQMQTYLSKTMGAKGNEVSLRMYGIKLMKEENYFPLRISDRYRETPTEQGPGRKMKNAGFTRAVTPNANNAIVLTPFLTVWGSHVDEMANYHAFVLPVEDFTRVYNYKEGVSSEESGSMSVKAAIQNAYGAAAADYVQRMLEDINGGVKGDKTTGAINKMISLQKKGATMASLSVVIQQPSSILRAMSMINPRYFIGPKMTERTQGRTWEEIKRYAPIAIIKEMGRFDVNMGKNAVEYLTGREYDTWSEKAKALAADSSYRDDVLGRWPALADEIGWSAIWNAVKRETRELHPDMDIHSQRFMDTVADRFTEIITHTQVYDSVFSRSANMRSRDTGMKMVTAFMAEPTVAINMMARAVADWKRTGNRKDAITTLSAVAAAQILNSALAAVVYAMRDDDEDETYGEKYISALTSGLLNSASPLSYVPLLRDVQSIMQGYDVERMDMSLIADFGDACKGLWDENAEPEEKITRFFTAGFQLTGVPVKNIIRDMAALKNTVETLARTERGTATGRSIAVRENLPFAGRYDDGEQMLLAIRKGDMAHLERVASRFENQQQAEIALRTAIGNAYKKGDLTEDEVTELLSTYTDMEGNDIYWKMDEWNYVRDTGDTDGYLKTGALQAAIESGEGIEEEIQRYKDHGMDDGDIRSNITRIYKKQYLEAAEEGREQIVAKVTPAYRAAGMDETDIAGTINGWDFESKYGMSYGEYKGEYRDGLVTERDMRQAMMDYGLRNFEIEEDIRDLNEDIDFMGRFGMSLSDMKAGYDDGDVTRNNLISALEYTGMSHEDAVEEVSRRDISNRLGIDYMKLDDAYKWDDISRQTFYNAMVENGATREEADEAITGYDWLKKHRATHPDLTISVAKKFTTRIHSDYAPDETLEDYGVSVDAYLEYAERRPQCKGIDADGDGYADSGTLRDDIFRMIDSLPISDRAKTGLALQSYSLKSIKKNAPWY